jgi:hypothetical protein
MATGERARWILASAVAAGSLSISHGVRAEGVAVEYRVPVGAPAGQVQVLSFGAAELAARSTIGSDRFVHVRLAAVNDSDAGGWVLDAREQALALPDGRVRGVRYAQAGGGEGPARLSLRPGERGYLDLFFPAGSDDPEAVEVRWRVRRGSEVLAGTTAFEELPAPASDYDHYWPSEFLGGRLVFGPLWCQPHWRDDWWLRHYGRYGRYSYAAAPGGFAIAEGDRSWQYRRDDRASAPDTVANHWRRQGPGGGSPVSGGGGWRGGGRGGYDRNESSLNDVGHQAGPSGGWGAQAAPSGATTAWHVTFHPGAEDRLPARTSLSGAGQSAMRGLLWGGASAASSAEGGGSSSSQSSSNGSSSSSSTSSSSSAPSPAPTPPATVGGHWRSR